MLAIDGYTYLQNLTVRNKVYWLCSQNRRIKCNARLVSDLAMRRFEMKKSAQQHNHRKVHQPLLDGTQFVINEISDSNE